MKLITNNAAERAYSAPMCEEMVIDEKQVLCTSIDGDQVTPGFGENWGIF